MTTFSKTEIHLQKQYKGFCKTPLLWAETLENQFTQLELPKDNTVHYSGTNINPMMYLGKRAECFLNHLLEKTNRYNVITQSLQIQQDKTTIGEIDAILYDTLDETYLHIEQVYKFYVYDDKNMDEGNETLNKWIGPNRKDSLK